MSKETPIIQEVNIEQYQGHDTRKQLFVQLEEELGRPVVAYFTSLKFPVMIEDDDAELLESVLRTMDLSNGLALLINSPGGIGEAAERIINICRNESGTGEFWAIVSGKAKSAATMVCFGASKILMGPNAELGPVDPQIGMIENGQRKFFSLCNLVESYEELFKKALAVKGNVQPYLQQLAHYDYREIKEYKAAISLAEDIAIRTLATGMMKGQKEVTIKKKIEAFLTPKRTKSHGRPIYRDEAEKYGLIIEKLDNKTRVEQLIFELYVRTLNFTNIRAAKCVESKNHAFSVRIGEENE